MKKLSALLVALLVSGAVFAQQTGTFQVGNNVVSGTATAGSNGAVVVTNTAGQSMTLTPVAGSPGTFTVTSSTIPGVAAGAGTTVTVTTGAAAGFGAAAGVVGGTGAVVAGAAFAAVVTINQSKAGSTSGST